MPTIFAAAERPLSDLFWSPETHARHAAPRLRPALDLLAAVPRERATSIVDLRCGSGALFPALRVPPASVS
jgi:trans-aconitate methyltransferase